MLGEWQRYKIRLCEAKAERTWVRQDHDQTTKPYKSGGFWRGSATSVALTTPMWIETPETPVSQRNI